MELPRHQQSAAPPSSTPEKNVNSNFWPRWVDHRHSQMQKKREGKKTPKTFDSMCVECRLEQANKQNARTLFRCFHCFWKGWKTIQVFYYPNELPLSLSLWRFFVAPSPSSCSCTFTVQFISEMGEQKSDSFLIAVMCYCVRCALCDVQRARNRQWATEEDGNSINNKTMWNISRALAAARPPPSTINLHRSSSESFLSDTQSDMPLHLWHSFGRARWPYFFIFYLSACECHTVHHIRISQRKITRDILVVIPKAFRWCNSWNKKKNYLLFQFFPPAVLMCATVRLWWFDAWGTSHDINQNQLKMLRSIYDSNCAAIT